MFPKKYTPRGLMFSPKVLTGLVLDKNSQLIKLSEGEVSQTQKIIPLKEKNNLPLQIATEAMNLYISDTTGKTHHLSIKSLRRFKRDFICLNQNTDKYE
jgi:hypothetical protein